MVLVDIHCHILPGVDDGSKDWETSIKLARDAVKDGITHAVCTPHMLNGKYINHKKDVIRLTENFQDMLDDAKIPLTVFPGQEVRINGQLTEALDNDDILFADESGKYMMLEFPDNDVPHYTNQMIFELQQRGIIPVIVHPERNTKIMEQPDLLYQMLEKGCLSQITASSYVGTFGKKVEDFSRKLIANGQGYLFASDAHDLPGRKYEMRQAFDKLNQEFDPDLAKRYGDNARAIINGENVPVNEVQPLKKRKRFWLF